MSLSYLNELKVAFENLSTIDDYKSFVDELECLSKMFKENLPFGFGTHRQTVKINEDSTYTSINRNQAYMSDTIIFDTEGKHVTPTKKVFLSRGSDLIFGFYTDTPMEFDIFVNDKLKNHYVLEEGKFYPLLNETSDKIVLVSLNTHEENTCWEIRNMNTNTNPFSLVLLTANLATELRNETSKSRVTDFALV
jgi:hypothetical protein